MSAGISALDLFGGELKYRDVVAFCRGKIES